MIVLGNGWFLRFHVNFPECVLRTIMGPSPQVNLFDPMTNDIQRPRHGAVCTLMVAFRSWANSLTARTTPRDPKPKSCPERPDSKPSVMEIWHEFLQLILFMTYSMIYEIGINQHYPKFTHSVPHVKLNPLPSHIISLSLRDHVYTIYVVYTNVDIYIYIWYGYIYIYTSTFKGVPIKP